MDMTKRELQYHIGLGPGDAGGWCILPGDPGRSLSPAARSEERRAGSVCVSRWSP